MRPWWRKGIGGNESLALAAGMEIRRILRSPIVFTVVLAHPDQHCPKFQVLGVYVGLDDRFTLAPEEFDDREKAERVARNMMEDLEADHFRRVIREAE